MVEYVVVEGGSFGWAEETWTMFFPVRKSKKSFLTYVRYFPELNLVEKSLSMGGAQYLACS